MFAFGIQNDIPKDFYDRVTQVGYQFGAKLGSGGFGAAYRCHYNSTDGVAEEEIAVKHLNLDRIYTPRYREPLTSEERQDVARRETAEQTRQRTLWSRLIGRGKRQILVEGTPNFRVVVEGQLLRSELQAMNRANHPNVVKLHNVFTYHDPREGSRNPNPSHILIFMELANGDLSQHSNKKYPELEIRNYSAQIARGLSHLHNIGIAHMDFKPENLLVMDTPGAPFNVTLKITDFGLSLVMPLTASTGRTTEYRGGTRAYRSPELVRIVSQYSSATPIRYQSQTFDEYDAYKSDVWGLGVIVMNLVISIQEFRDEYFNVERDIAADANYNIGQVYMNKLNGSVSEIMYDFLAHIFLLNETNRFSAVECCKHQWLNEELAGERSRVHSFSGVQ